MWSFLSNLKQHDKSSVSQLTPQERAYRMSIGTTMDSPCMVNGYTGVKKNPFTPTNVYEWWKRVLSKIEKGQVFTPAELQSYIYAFKWWMYLKKITIDDILQRIVTNPKIDMQQFLKQTSITTGSKRRLSVFKSIAPSDQDQTGSL